MPVLCTVSGVVRDSNGALLQGAVVSIGRAIVGGTRSTTYETSTTTNSSGEFSFTVPQGARVRFSSNDVSALNNWFYTVPNMVTAGLGVFRADAASETGARDATGVGSVPAAVAAYVSAREYGNAAMRKTVLTLTALPVTLVKNGTSTGGGGTKIYDLPEGLIQPLGGSSNLTIAAAGDKSFLASVGSAAADTGGSLSSTEISFLPSTAATTSSGAGTCKMKSNSTTPTPGATLDGTSSAAAMYLNAALNADATGVEALTFSGTITITWVQHGDN